MPISNTFDPYTGAANGGGVPDPGGASLYDVPYGDLENLTDGSWTLVDPLGLVKSISYDAGTGFHSIVWNAALASQDLNWSAGTNHTAPRWFKNAEIDGTGLTSDDIVNTTFYIDVDNVNRGTFDNAIGWGICVDPTSTDANTIAACGLYANTVISNNNTALGVWTVNGSASTTSGTHHRCVTTYQYGGRHCGSGVFTLVDDLGYRVQNGSRNANITIPDGQDLKWIVGVGTRGNTIPIPQDATSQQFKIRKIAVKYNLGAVL
jgi:hypothetical protein